MIKYLLSSNHVVLNIIMQIRPVSWSWDLMFQIQVEIAWLKSQTQKDDVCGLFVEVSSTMALNAPNAVFPMEGHY